MTSQPHNSPNIALTLKAARSLLTEAGKSPWLAMLLLRSETWLGELARRLSCLSRQTRRIFCRALTSGLSALAVLAATCLCTSPAHAATITVDGTTCTLPNAITAANTDSPTGGCLAGASGADTITLKKDTIVYSALPNITSEITIEANGFMILPYSSTQKIRVFTVNTGGNLTLNDAYVTNGHVENQNGGGIAIFGTGIATIKNSSISGNFSSDDGGGIYCQNKLTIQDSLIYNNTASTSGGGIYGEACDLTIENSTISANNGIIHGGGILSSNGDVLVKNSTISDNYAGYAGGGIKASSFSNLLTIENSTIIQNSAVEGGGIHTSIMNASIKNSIIASQSSGTDCFSNGGSIITSQGYNIESASTCGFTSSGDQQNVSSGSLNLGALADNGGPTQTRALGSGSVAIDQIPNGTNGCTAGTSVDQRGAARANGVNMGGSACDVGAYEANSTQTPTALKVRAFAASTRSPAGIIAAFMAAVTAGGAGWLGWRRGKK